MIDKNKFFLVLKNKIVISCLSTALLLVCILIYSTFFTTGYSVYANGKFVGNVFDKSVALSTLDNVNTEIRAITGEGAVINSNLVFMPAVLLKTADVNIEANIKNLSFIYHRGYSVYVDGIKAVTLKDKITAKNVITNFKKLYTNKDCEIVSNFKIKKDNVIISDLANEEYAIKILAGQKGDNTPVVKMKTTQIETMSESVNYETEQVYSDDTYKGKEVIVRNGVTGENQITASVTRLGGVEISRKIISTQPVASPVNKIVKIGTKPLPSSSGTGSFIKPFYGTITSRFGERRGRSRHLGLDISGSIGSPIKSADNGKVTFAGWDGDYGMIVKIDHENGYETWYAHLSAIDVKVGDVVAKNDCLGALGNTGRSTGPHLHFEVRQNGKPVDPSIYVK